MKKLLSIIILSLILCFTGVFAVACGNKEGDSGDGGDKPAVTFTVTFDGNGGTLESGTAVQTVQKAADIIAPTFTREGYTFSNWDVDLSTITKDTTVKALWTEITFIVRFYSNGGTLKEGLETQQVARGSDIVAPVYEKPGYTLSFDKDFNDVTEECNISAVWTANKYTVSFSDNLATAMEVTFGQSIGTLPIPADKTEDGIGYKFSGWKYGENIVNNNAEYTWTEDITLTAVWTEKTFTVTFEANGGTLVSGEKVQEVRNSSEIVAPTFEKVGYGYNFDKTLAEITETCTVNVVWTANKYTISFKDNLATSIQATYNQAIPTLPNLGVKEEGGVEYKFVGWKYDGNLVNSGSIYGWVKDVELIAEWTESENYTITYNDCESAVGFVNSFTENTDTFVIPNPTRKGYTFSGWTGTGLATPTKDLTIEKGSTGDRVYTATWTTNTYTISYDCLTDTTPVTFGAQIGGLYQATTKSEDGISYTFAGWEYNGQMINSQTEYVWDTDIELVAKWDAVYYTVTFNGNGGVVVAGEETQSIKVASELVAPSYARTGYTFVGWDKDLNSITGECEVKALWTAKEYTVTLSATDGTITVTSFTIKYGQKVGDAIEGGLPVPTNPDRKFTGWKFGTILVENDYVWDIDQEDVTLVSQHTKAYKFVITLESIVYKKSVFCKFVGASVAYLEVNEGGTFTLPNVVPEDEEEYSFSYWKYVDTEGHNVKVTEQMCNNLTLFTNVPEVDENGVIVIELIAQCKANWTPFC